MPSVTVNSTSIYYELRGSGPPLLIVAGALGDTTHYEGLAELLADEFTVVTYDRRGYSRSPRPDGWKTTSTDEQADDAVGLLAALSLTPAAVFGHSSGAIITLDLVIRHPEVVRCAILHEPPLFYALQRPEEPQAEFDAAIEKGMEAGGPPAAVENFIRWVAGDASWEAMEPALRQRLQANGETFFGVELANPEPYHPDDATLAAVTVPVQVMASDQTKPFFAEAAAWLAARLGVEVVRTPGTHTPQFDHAAELAANIRSFLREPKNRT